MNTGDTKTVYVHMVYACIRRYVCILKFCLPQTLFLKMLLKLISAVERSSKKNRLKFYQSASFYKSQLQGSGPNGSKGFHYFEKGDTPAY